MNTLASETCSTLAVVWPIDTLVMKKSLVVVLLLVFFVSCKKEDDKSGKAPLVPEVELRIVNQGNSNVQAFVIWSQVYLQDNRTVYFIDKAFNGIGATDTAILKVNGLSNENPDFFNAKYNYRLRIAYRNKVFSQIHFNNNFIQEGQPYDYGWTYSRNFRKTGIDSIQGTGKQVIYIHWPQDSAKLEEVFFF